MTASKLISESTAFEAATLSAALACFLNLVLQAVVVTVYPVYARIVPSVTSAYDVPKLYAYITHLITSSNIHVHSRLSLSLSTYQNTTNHTDF